MSKQLIECASCNFSLQENFLNNKEFMACPSCKVPLIIKTFPALSKPLLPGQAADVILADNEASCFYHPEKQAVIHCENCGRFLCALCDVEFNKKHLCPSCLESGSKKGKIKALQKGRILYDEIALSVAVIPILMFYFTIITAPIAIFISIWFWRKPSSIIPRTKIRFIIAIIISFLQLTGWFMIFFLIAKGFF